MSLEVTAEQGNNNKPWLFKKGQSGNPNGRPKGSVSLKEWARIYLRDLNDEEKIEFIEGLPKDIIWKMAEGNPKQDTDVTSGGKSIVIDKDTKEKIDTVIGSFINDNTGNITK